MPESQESNPADSSCDPKKLLPNSPEDTTVAYRNEVSQILEDYFGLTIEKHHHEVSTVGQVEIDYKYGELLETADRALYFKFVAKNIAKKHGLSPPSCLNPSIWDNASGMHVTHHSGKLERTSCTMD